MGGNHCNFKMADVQTDDTMRIGNGMERLVHFVIYGHG